jgi:hypothetical protein
MLRHRALAAAQTSALTMNIAGVVKDWLLIGLSVLLYQSPISRVNLGGYSIAFVSVRRWKLITGRAMSRGCWVRRLYAGFWLHMSNGT